jgi:hypothetical protein
MRAQGFVQSRIGDTVFILNIDNKRYKISFNFKHFPEEYARLLGHTCRLENAGVTVAFDGDNITDVRFDVEDNQPGSEEESIVQTIIGDGQRECFLQRACGCSIHFSSYYAIGFGIDRDERENFGGFEVGQRWRHGVAIHRNRVETIQPFRVYEPGAAWTT